jgi:hypothetical protein
MERGWRQEKCVRKREAQAIEQNTGADSLMQELETRVNNSLGVCLSVVSSYIVMLCVVVVDGVALCRLFAGFHELGGFRGIERIHEFGHDERELFKSHRLRHIRVETRVDALCVYVAQHVG